jgi:hypothetical protein
MAAPSATRERPDRALVYAALVIVAGVLATTLAQTQVLAGSPMRAASRRTPTIAAMMTANFARSGSARTCDLIASSRSIWLTQRDRAGRWAAETDELVRLGDSKFPTQGALHQVELDLCSGG